MGRDERILGLCMQDTREQIVEQPNDDCSSEDQSRHFVSFPSRPDD
jgi:hypothetical protein